MASQAGAVPVKLGCRRLKPSRISVSVAYSFLMAGIMLHVTTIFYKFSNIHRLPKHIIDCDKLQYVHWPNLGHIYKRKLAIEMFKAKHMLNRLSPHVKAVESRPA